MGFSPPNSRAEGSIRVDSGVGRMVSEGLARTLTIMINYIVVTHMVSEIYALWATTRHQALDSVCPMNSTAISTPYPAHRIPLPALPPLLLIIFGGFLRMVCHRQLGKMFTWETSIIKDHKLIVNGPYRFVRHPSYTGMVSLCIGYFWFLNVPETFAKECFFGSGLLPADLSLTKNSLGMLYASGYFLLYLDSCVFVVRRSFTEDAMLKQKFGKEWNDWAGRVPWNVLPYVL